MKNKSFFLTFIVFFSIIFFNNSINACTTAIIGVKASKSKIPMLWKNRDTGYLSNKIIFVKESPFSYIGIINAKETSGNNVYAGLNSQGFGIINTVAYNLPIDKSEFVDLEGRIMADALRLCKTVDDFEKYIKKNLGRTLGSWANYGVIDANGKAVVFEIYNHGYYRIDTNDSNRTYIVNTNFARNGKKGKGAGYIRFEQATKLFKKIPKGKITHEYIFKNISRNFGHPYLIHPTLNELKNRTGKTPFWIFNGDCIDRPSTSAAIIINGKRKQNSVATMWVILGEPLSSIAVPLWVEAETVPDEMLKGEKSVLNSEALRIKKIIHPFTEGNKKNYMNLAKLVNKEKKGFLPILLKTENEIFIETEKFLKKTHTKKEYADFQNKMAEKALRVLKTIK